MLEVKQKGKPFRVDLERLNSSPGIYKILFSSGEFYIGATANLKKRVRGYESNFRTGFFESKRLIAAFNNSEYGSFVILEECAIGNIKARERFLIAANKDNPLILNRSTGGDANEGIKWSDSEKQALSKSLRESFGKKKPSRKRRGEVLCETYGVVFKNSYAAAAALDVCQSKVSACCNGNALHAKGLTFRYIQS